jgi:hypothetical protein
MACHNRRDSREELARINSYFEILPKSECPSGFG